MKTISSEQSIIRSRKTGTDRKKNNKGCVRKANYQNKTGHNNKGNEKLMQAKEQTKQKQRKKLTKK